MLGTVGRALRMWRAKSKLLAPYYTPQPSVFYSPDLLFPELQEVFWGDWTELEPYQGLAEVWDDSCVRVPDYASFLPALARHRGAALRSVLDLACGTGLLTPGLAERAGEVVGLDASEPMLSLARKRHGDRPGVSFIRGDFRDFDLDRQFDAAVCASNSLNYVTDRAELSQVLTAVGRHLRPGGLFVFDTQTERCMRRASGLYYHVQRGGGRFALRFSYDAERRRETSQAILPAGVELHRRIPLDPVDVIAAVGGTGLEVADYFASALWPRDWWPGQFCFFVLVKRA